MVEEETKEEKAATTEEKVEGGEEGITEEMEQALPFPSARVVRIIKENFEKPHQLRAEVKIAANQLLGDILKDVSKSMDNEEFFTIGIEHFNKAARKYRTVDLQAKRIERIKKLLEKQRVELEEAIMDIEASASEV
ncbi:hypothetical protein HY570_03335 [Candidatus Micrarchaeota archaeon]|nr:hypothetical protein [Candidatus Micrarchaeota archaeon]